MNLSSINLSQYDTPVTAKSSETASSADDLPKNREIDQAQAADSAQGCQIVTIKRTSTGEEILLCMTDPAPPEALSEAERLGLALFTPSEIPHIKAAAAVEPGYIEKIIEIKLAFPGTRVAAYRPEAAA